MNQLQVQQQSGKIGLIITPFKFDLKITQADLEVKQYPAQIEIEQPAATLEIDYTAFRESIGYRGSYAQMQSFNDDAKNTCGQGIERRAVEGEMLSDTSKKSGLVRIIHQSIEPQIRDLQIMRTETIKIRFMVNNMKFDVNLGGVKTSFTPATIKSQFEYGNVKTFLEQKPSIEIKATGSNIDLSI